MENEFKIRIISDSKGTKLSLQNITIEAAEAFNLILESFTSLASLYDNSSDFKISLESASIGSSLVFPSYDQNVAMDIYAIINGQSKDNKKIKILKDIQDRVKLNGLDYQLTWKINNEVEDLTEIFKGKSFSYKRKSDQNIKQTVFMKGTLYNSGGRRQPKLQLGKDDDPNITFVDCSKATALSMISNLYQEVYISVIRSTRRDGKFKPELEFIDSYTNLEEQLLHSKFYKSIINDNSLLKFDRLRNKLCELINENNIRSLKKMVMLFDTAYTERGILRTILMTMKPIINKSEFAELKYLYECLSGRLRDGSSTNTI